MRRLLPHIEGRAALVIAALFSVPIFLATLLVTSLALDRPRIAAGREFPSTSGTEAKVWVTALLAPAILFGIGVVALALRRLGIYLVLAAAFAMCALLPSAADRYIPRHARRFPLGLDYLSDSSPSNTSSRGEWEHAARETVASMTHWMFALLGLAVLIVVWLDVRRRLGRTAAPVPPPPETVGAPDIVVPPLEQ
jgi:hypothetical protein